MSLQFHLAVEHLDVWTASSADDISFVVTFAMATSGRGSGVTGHCSVVIASMSLEFTGGKFRPPRHLLPRPQRRPPRFQSHRLGRQEA